MTDYPVTFPADGSIALSVKQRAGDVFVAATDTETVHVDVRPANDGSGSHDLVRQTRVDFRPSTPSGVPALSIDVPRSANLGFGNAAVDLVLTVPTGTTAEIETGSGDVQLRGEFIEASVTTGSGDIVVECVTEKEGRFTTGSGDVRLGDVPYARVKTGSGDVRIERADGDLTVDTGSGDVDAGLVGGTAFIRVASGDITVRELSGQAELKSASGGVEVRRANQGELRVRTASGDLTVGIAAGTAAKLDCSSITGRVVSELDATEAPGDDDRLLTVTSTSASGSVILRRS